MTLFTITKTILYLALPPSLLILLIGFGFLFIKRCPRLGKGLVLTGLLLLYLLSIRPVSGMLIHSLESDITPLEKVDAKQKNRANRIVVLGGGAMDISWTGMQPTPSRASTVRLVYGIMLYRQIPYSTLIISGGSGDPENPDISEAKAMKELAIKLGVPPRDIITEETSRNTLENALRLQYIIRDKKILLVTSAYHMKRAMAMFKKTGVDVVPAPTDYRSEHKEISFFSFIPNANNMANSSTAISEYISTAWYKLLGAVES